MAEPKTHAWRHVVRERVLAAAALFALWAIGIEARLVYLQVFQHADLSARAERQQSRTIEATAKRGDILDRQGRLLASSVDVDSVYAVSSEISNPRAVATSICAALRDCQGKDVESIVARLEKKKPFAYVRRQVSPAQARRIAALKLDAVGFVKESRRYYPNRELAAPLLGYVGLDSDGLGGIEATYDGLIKGQAGTLLIQTDARRQAFSRIERSPTAGASLELTVDGYIQHVAERELRAGVLAAGAHGGAVIVMDPRTGELLAVANYPTFNPNEFRDFAEEVRRNRAVQDSFEPGSTFKLVTGSAAIQERVLTPDTVVDTSPGRITFGSRVIDEDKGHNYGALTFTDVIVKSSNVGAIKVGLQVGAERLSDYATRFGFGRPSSPDFKGESAGIVWPASGLTDSALASVSMGYQVSVTPLQMAAAVSAVANGGQLVQPRVVRAVIKDGQRMLVPHRVRARVINSETAAEMTSIMEAVVERGTGTRAQVAGYTVAGKTGTAQKIVDRRYSTSDYNVSFVGFVPSRRPALAIVVVVDSPKKVAPYGGTVAGPIFGRVADAALRHLGVPPTVDGLPPVLVARQEAVPVHVSPTSPPAVMHVSTDSAMQGGTVPDVRGLGAREAVRIMARLGFSPRLVGSGIVTAQTPTPGANLDGSVSTLWLERRVTAAGGPPSAEPSSTVSEGAARP